jgi:hypothetical protein
LIVFWIASAAGEQYKPGGLWQGLAIQDLELEDLSRNGYLVCGLCHSHSDKEIDRRVILKSNNKA